MARRVQLATPAAAARPCAVPGRIIGGRELPTSPLTTDSDGPPCAAGNPGGLGAIPGRIIGGRELPTSPLTTGSDGPSGEGYTERSTVSLSTCCIH